jgi:hypothetical protein
MTVRRAIERAGFAYGIAATVISLALQVAAWMGASVLPPSSRLGAGLLTFHVCQLYFVSGNLLIDPHPVLAVTRQRVRLGWGLVVAVLLLMAAHVFAIAVVTFEGGNPAKILRSAVGSSYLAASVVLMVGWGLTLERVLPWKRRRRTSR